MASGNHRRCAGRQSSLGLSSSPRGLDRRSSLGFSGVTRRAGSKGRSIVFTHWESMDKLSIISVPSFLTCKMGMETPPPFIRFWEDYMKWWQESKNIITTLLSPITIVSLVMGKYE